MLFINNYLRTLSATALLFLICATVAEAKKPPKPPGDDSRPSSYTIVTLDNGGGTHECYARSINNLGNAVGYIIENTPTSDRRAVYWEVTGTGSDIESTLKLLAVGYGAYDINDFGEIVGYGDGPNGRNIGLYWPNSDALPLALPPLSEGGYSSAKAISNDGVVCGASDGLAVAWRVNWVEGQPSVQDPIAMPTLDERSWSGAVSNNDGEGFALIAGVFRSSSNRPTAVVSWTVQTLGDGTLAVDPLPRVLETGETSACGVNDGGAVCGQAEWPAQARVWTESTTQTLDLARKMVVASAQDINNSGTIVGWGGPGQLSREAVVWPSADGDMIQLNKFVGRKSPFLGLIEANAVNETGVIVGIGITVVGGSGRTLFLAIPK